MELAAARCKESPPARQDKHEPPEQARKGDPKERPLARVPLLKVQQQGEQEREARDDDPDGPAQQRESGKGETKKQVSGSEAAE